MKARPGGPPFAADSRRVRITIRNGSRMEVICGKLVSESTNWIIILLCLDTLAIEFLIQHWRRVNGGVGRQYETLRRLTMSTLIPT